MVFFEVLVFYLIFVKTTRMIKKLLFVLVFIVSINSKAQTGVTNLSFENWSNTIFGYEPNGWFGITISQQTVGAQQGTSYARIMTTSTVSSGFDGVMSLATISSSNIVNGAAYNQKPVSISGFYKTSGLGVND